jgi:hypothetical protein
MDYKRSARQESTHFVESRISNREDNPILTFFRVFSSKFVLKFATQDIRLSVVEQY